METKLKKLEQQKARLDAQIAKEKTKISSKQRKEETRRKILTGAVVLEEMKKDEDLKSKIDELLALKLTLDNDRVLFNLPIIKKKTKANNA